MITIKLFKLSGPENVCVLSGMGIECGCNHSALKAIEEYTQTRGLSVINIESVFDPEYDYGKSVIGYKVFMQPKE